MTIEQLTQYLERLKLAMPALEQRLRKAEADVNMQLGAIEAVQRILTDAQTSQAAQAAQAAQAEEEHEHIHD